MKISTSVFSTIVLVGSLMMVSCEDEKKAPEHAYAIDDSISMADSIETEALLDSLADDADSLLKEMELEQAEAKAASGNPDNSAQPTSAAGN